jgi:hypothetical protein
MIAKCKFSNKWIRRFLDRFRLSRQRITATIKAKRPPEGDVQLIMAGIQAEFAKHGLEICDILCVMEYF